VSLQAVIARIAEIDGIVQAKQPAPASAPNGFLTALNGVEHGSALPATPAVPATTGTGASGALSAAQSQVGVSEQPPGSNDGPQIAQYRTATAGSGVGPWCAYFVSWAAAQAGTPLGEAGQGFGSVSAVYDWAQRTGRATPAGPGVRPNPGDLIVWGGRHIGIVESVDPDGSIHTIEGNSSNAVSRRTYGPDGGGATGYVRLG
jgi:CHAP domain